MEGLIATISKMVEGWPLPDKIKPIMTMAIPLTLKIIYALAILMVGKVVAGWVENLVKKVLLKAKVDESLTIFLANIARYTVLAAAVIATLEQVGIKATGLLAVFASAGLAVGLALQGSLSNFAAGAMILGFRPFKIGDIIDAAGVAGCVQEIGIFTTSLLTLDNEVIIVPNSAISGGTITNFTKNDYRRVSTDIGVAYGEDLHKVEEVLMKAAAKTKGRLEDHKPNVFITGFGASSVDFNVRVFTNHENYWGVIHDLRKQVYDGLNEAGIDIPFTTLTLLQDKGE